MKRGRTRAFVHQPQDDAQFSALHRLLTKAKPSSQSTAKPLPPYSMRLVFSFASISSNAANVSNSVSTVGTISRSYFECNQECSPLVVAVLFPSQINPEIDEFSTDVASKTCISFQGHSRWNSCARRQKKWRNMHPNMPWE
jgi:hypothetical protein